MLSVVAFAISEAELPTLHELLESYKRSLLAQVQRQEFLSWGQPVLNGFAAEIAAHVRLEREYLEQMIDQRRRAATPRERGDTTRFGMPPQVEPGAGLPEVLPWDREIADLSDFWLEVTCSCARTTFVPLRRLAGEIGWSKTLREVVPKLRCSRPGCGGIPASVLLVNDSSGRRWKSDSKACWYQLVPAGDEAVFPH